MSERRLAVTAIVTWSAAFLAIGVPPLVGGLALALGLLTRRPWLLAVGAALLASGLAHRAVEGLDRRLPARLAGEVVLVSDPERFGDDLRVEVRHDGARLEAWADGARAERLAARLAGERVVMQGRVESFAERGSWRVARHLTARVVVSQVGAWRPGAAPTRWANGVRRTIVSGAASMSRDQRTLLVGLVLGDDRGQPPRLVDDFRAAGLTHLLAVSGQNVAFLLLLLAPVTRRLPVFARLVGTVVALAGFALLTRFEPSVLRATAMALVVVVAATAGRPATGRRALLLGVTGVVLVDPLIVHAVGFQLSVLATLGLLVVLPRIRPLVPGPPWAAVPVAVVVAAQVAVAPLLLVTFDEVPVASLPANLLAAPAAGPAMVWGMTAGVVAGLVPPGLAALLHVPTRVLVGWVALVADEVGGWPLRSLTPWSLAVLVLGLAMAVGGVRRHPGDTPGWGRRAGLAVAVAASLAPAVAHGLRPVPVRVAPEPGMELWRRGGATALVLSGGTRPVDVLAGARRAGVRRIDVLVLEEPDGDTRSAVDALAARYGRPLMVGPAAAGADVVLGPGRRLTIGGLVITGSAGERPPTVAVASQGAPGARAPPLRRDP